MSKQIDERVVSMQFDNKHFESNVQTSISTLDKLKRALHLDGATKGLDNVSAAARNVNLSPLGGAVETVSAKFSALQVMGVTALANITNSAVNAGKQLAASLTITPIKTGFNEYELKMGSIQTIMASTGESLETVNKYLDELNKYSDQTIYSFQDMTSNIGKFTNAGVKLEDAVLAIKGISNEAAVSGANANEASRAMYNFAQALSSGYVKLIDWKSIELANMATVEFKNQLIETGLEMGTLVKEGNKYKTTTTDLTGKVSEAFDATSMFNDSLAHQWMTSEVLIGTLKEYADETTEIGKKASQAATEVKTFSQLMDTLKESAQSGWAKTWEILVGDYNEAKNIFTKISEVVGGFLDKISNARNKLLEGVMSYTPFGSLTEKLKSTDIKKVDKYAKATENLTDKLEYYQKVVDKVWRGDYKNAPVRYGLLEDDGYNATAVQKLVNLGYKYKLTVDDIAKAEEAAGIATKKGTEAKQEMASTIADLSDEELKNLGFTKEEITTLRELSKEADEAGISLEELIKKMEKPTGRELLFDSLKNLGEAISKPLKAIKEAWTETFDPVTEETLYRIIEKFHDLTESLIMSDDAAENFKKVFEGLFAAFQLGHSVFSMTVLGALKIAGAVLELFGTNLLEVAAHLADYIIKFRDWVDEHTIFINTYNKIAKVITTFINGITRVAQAIWQLKPVQNLISNIAEWFTKLFGSIDLNFEGSGIDKFCSMLDSMFTSLEKWIKGLENSDNIGRDILRGLVNGLQAGAKWVWDAMLNIGTTILETICNVLGIESPSKKFFEIGNNIIQGLVNGLKKSASAVWGWIKTIGAKCVDIFKQIDFGALIAAGIGVGMLYVVNKIVNLADKLVSPLEGFASMCKNIGGAVRDVGTAITKNLKAKTWRNITKSILDIAIAIGILAASIALLTLVDQKKMWNAVGALSVLTAVVVALAIAAEKMNNAVPKKNAGIFNSFGVSMLAITVGLLLMAKAMTQLASIDVEKVPVVLKTFAGMIAGLLVVMIAFGKFVKSPAGAKNIDKAGIMLLKMSAALLIITFVIKQIAKLDNRSILRGLAVIALVELLFVAVVKVSQYSGEHASKAGSMLLKMSAAMLIMAFTIKTLATINGGDIAKGLGVVAAIEALFIAAVAVSKWAGENATKAGSMLLMMSAAMWIMGYVIKQMAQMSEDDVKKGLGIVAAIEVLFGALIAVSKFAGQHAAKAGTMLLMMSGALLILTGVLFLLSLMVKNNQANLWEAVGIIAVLEVLFAGLIAATYLAKDCKATLIILTVVVTLLVGALIGLSFIDPTKLATAGAALSGVIAAFALLVAALQFVQTGQKAFERSMATLGILAGVVAVLAGVLAVMSFLPDVSGLIPTATSIGILLLAMSASLAVMSYSKTMSKEKLSRTTVMLVALSGVIAVLGGVLAVMSMLNVGNAIANATALSIVLLAMSASIAILNVFGATLSVKELMAASLGMAALTGVLALLGLVLAMMTALNVSDAITNATVLSGLLVVLTGVAVVMGLFGGLWINMLTGALGLAALTGVLALIGLVLAMMSALKINDVMTQVEALVTLLTVMADICVKLAIVGPLALVGIVAMSALTNLMIAVGIFAVAIGALMEKFPALKQFLDTGLAVMIQLAGGIGEMIGAFVGGIAAGVISYLPPIGLALSQFMINAMPFITGCKLIDNSVAKGVGILVLAIGALMVASFIDSVMQFLPIVGSIADLGTQLSLFMINAMPFINGASMLNPTMVESVKTLAEAILVLTAANMVDGIMRILNMGGPSALERFGEQLPLLGAGINGFVTNLGTLTDEQVSTATRAAEIIKTLAEAAKTIPNSGGWLGAIVGDNDIGPWANQLPIMAKGLAGFTNTLVEAKLSEDSVDLAKKAAEIITVLAEAAAKIPNSGGWLADMIGDNDFSTWAKQLPNVGKGIAGFTSALVDGKITSESVELAKNAAEIVKALAAASSEIPNSGGWLASLVGDNDFSTWATQLPNVGKGVAGFADELGTFDESKLATINCAVEAIRVIADMSQNYAAKTDGKDFSSFGNGMIQIATKIKDFTDKIGEVSTDVLDSAIDKVNKVIYLSKTIAEINVDSCKTFGNSLKEVAKEGIGGFVKAFTDKDPKTQITDASKALLDAFVKGAKSKKDDVIGAFEEIAKAADDKVATKARVGDFEQAGKDLAAGLVKGINAKKQDVYDAAYALGQKAVQGEKDGQQSKSPSKLTIKAGKWLGEGLIIGINKMESLVYKSGFGLGQTATDTISAAIAKVSDFINNDIDAQPTIRPVLDLSDVEAGASTIGGMFSGRTLSVSAQTAGIVSASMANRQNGNDSAEIVSAIKALRKDINNMPHESITIDGITYSGDSEINDAVQTLVRAARIGRRS